MKKVITIIAKNEKQKFNLSHILYYLCVKEALK